jgi:hypothetical protein
MKATALTKPQMVALLKAADKTQFNFNKGTRVRCPSIPAMVEFIKKTWPDLVVTVSSTSQRKPTKPRGFRYSTNPGRRLYTGRLLRVATKGGETLLSHDTTETYRHNTDVARWIIQRLERKSP